MARDQSSHQSPLEIAVIRMHRSRTFQCVKEGHYNNNNNNNSLHLYSAFLGTQIALHRRGGSPQPPPVAYIAYCIYSYSIYCPCH